MASDLIYRKDAKDFIQHAHKKGLNPIEYLDEVPAADVRPVVRGYWKPVRESEISGYDPALSGQDPIYMHICSNCGNDSYLDENGKELLTAFCPMCGADMEGEK